MTRNLAWMLLLASGLLDVAWAVSMKYAQGYTRLGWSVVSLALLAAFVCLLGRSRPVGTAYAVRTGVGAVGGDVLRTPLPLSWAIVRRDGTVDLFIEPGKLAAATRRPLEAGVAIRPPEAFREALEALVRSGATMQVDPGAGPVLERELGTPFAVIDLLARAGAALVCARDPCALPKAAKNPVEVQGARDAHRATAPRWRAFWPWLAGEAPEDHLTERDAAARIDALRADDPLLVEPSFATMSAAGPHSALPHYRSTAATNRPIRSGELCLSDSGGQYLDGITRRPLWDAGLDFGHGTGHGVGSHLNVHEGPQSISTAPTSAPA